uniref:Uncharacterized protein n=1 Tax=Rhizophora mucronata TaxID=61149 RepID=A0A2P2NQ89_RHIMU
MGHASLSFRVASAAKLMQCSRTIINEKDERELQFYQTTETIAT